MSKDQLAMDEALEEGGEIVEAAPAKPKWSREKLGLVGAVALLVLGGGVGGTWMLLGSQPEAASAAVSDEPAVYVEAPAMTVNMRSPDGQPRFLKLRFVLVATEAGQEEKIKSRLPALLDAYQPFLRELRPDDLSGSAAAFRIKEELLVRATGILGASVVKDVLIQDLVQQ